MKNIKSILYLGWLGQGNVGDDVLFEFFQRMFYQSIDRSNNKFEYIIDQYIPYPGYKYSLESYDLVVLGGGSLISLPYWLDLCKDAQSLGVPVVSWGTGIDGFYTVDSLDNKKEIYNLMTEDIIDKILEVVGGLKYISVRGMLTKKILEYAGVDSKKINCVGDPALLYNNGYGKSSSKSKNVLINWGTSNNNIFGRDETKVEEQLETAIQILLNKGYSVTIYPIWVKDIPYVQRLGQKFTESNLSVIDQVIDAKGLIRLISENSFTINLKLHANILSAAMDIPFISLAYRGKCFDFADSVNCNDLAVSTDQLHAGKILELVDFIEQNYEEVAERLRESKKHYEVELIKVFDIINGLLEE